MSDRKTALTYKHKLLKDNTAAQENSKIPESVYASDGRQFFPCKFCCLAYAEKTEQLRHMRACSFKEDSPVPTSPPHAKARKSFSKPPVVRVQISTSPNGFKKPLPPVQISSKSPKHQNNVALKNRVKSAFPKIKLNPASIMNNSRLAEEDEYSDEGLYSSSNVCMECGEVFINKILLSQHKKEHHPKIYLSTDILTEYDVLYRRSDMTKCVICDKPVTKPQWVRHLATHAEEKMFECSFCSSKFRRKDQKKVHEKTHTG